MSYHTCKAALFAALLASCFAAFPVAAQEAPLQKKAQTLVYIFKGIQTTDVAWLKQAAELGHPAAQLALANQYRQGKVVARDPAQQIYWLTKAADRDFAWAAYELGRVYETGDGIPPDMNLALTWYRKAAELKLVPAFKRLADLKDGTDQGQAWQARYNQDAALDAKYFGFIKLVRTGKLSDAEMYDGLSKLGEAGQLRAKSDAALRLITGKGTAANPQVGVKLLEEADGQDFAGAALYLGELYLTGQGVPRDVKRGVTYLNKAIAGNQLKAMTLMARLFESGTGVAQDLVSAQMLFRLAGEQGVAEAQFHLGMMAENGLGEARDREKAISWYRLAAQSNDKKAQDALKRLGAGLPPTSPSSPSTLQAPSALPLAALKAQAMALGFDSVCHSLSTDERSVLQGLFLENAAKLKTSTDPLLAEAKAVASRQACGAEARKIIRNGLAAAVRPHYQDLKAKDAEVKLWSALLPSSLVNRRCGFFGEEKAQSLNRFAAELNQRVQLRFAKDQTMSVAIPLVEEEFANLANKVACDDKARKQVENALKFADKAARKGGQDF